MTHTTKQRRLLGFFLPLIALLFSVLTVNAQVTIGSAENPVGGAILDLKQFDKAGGDYNSHKGLMLPRVTLSQKKQLFPMFLADPEDPTSGANAEYSQSKAALDKSHTGLVVYNLVENDDEELCLGLNQWDGEQWNCFQSKMGNALFDPVSCDNIAISGIYVEGAALDASHHISITVNVKKEGAYTVRAETENGYSFYGTGVAMNKGTLTIELVGQGTPVAESVDKLIFSGITLAAGCEPSITVGTSLAEFSLSCSDMVVNGAYLKGRALDATNTISVRVTVSQPGSYTITTPLTNGIRFSVSGEFTVAGSQQITLLGTGTPTVVEDFPITVNASTPQGNAECSVTIPVTLPAMTYATIGTPASTYTWDSAERRQALTNTGQGVDVSFGPNGTVKIESLTRLWVAGTATAGATELNAGLNGTKPLPDVVLYFAYGAPPNAAISTALVDYIKRGGSVIYGSADNTSADVNVMMQGIFGIQPAQPQVDGDDDVYPIANNFSDPVINGPFGNLAGRHWGEDNASVGSVIMTQLPPNSVQVCTARSASKTSQNPAYSIVWYNDSYNFLYIGDSVGSTSGDLGTRAYPSLYSSTGLPRSKNYGSPTPQFIYNSALELNAVAWALKKAAKSGINPH